MAICYHCFREKDDDAVVCPFCGYDPSGSEKKHPLALRPGSILNGRYVVGRVLGEGGFGITYLAQDYQTKQRVAVKEYFPSEFAGRGGGTQVQVFSGELEENFRYGLAQFLEEARTLAAVTGSENIVRIYSYFEENGTAYFTMEYVEGLPLDDYIRSKGRRLSAAEADELLLPLMSALQRVHRKGIVHRDIAPDNIIVTKDGTAKLIDFGAARYSTGEKSRSLDVILKHGFAPMEQYTRRGRQGPWTDVYAMAATYYFAITGKVPPDAIERIEQDDLVPPRAAGAAVSPVQERALLKALAVQAPERWQDMGQFRAAMQTAQFAAPDSEAQPPESPHTSPASPTQMPAQPQAAGSVGETGKKKRSPVALIAAAAVVLALGIFGAVKLLGNGSPAVTAAPASTLLPAEAAAQAETQAAAEAVTEAVMAETPEPVKETPARAPAGQNPDLKTPYGLFMWDVEHNGAAYSDDDLLVSQHCTARSSCPDGKKVLLNMGNVLDAYLEFGYADGMLLFAFVYPFGEKDEVSAIYLYFQPDKKYILEDAGGEEDPALLANQEKYAKRNAAAIRSIGERLRTEQPDELYDWESRDVEPVSFSQAPATDAAVSGKLLVPLELENTRLECSFVDYSLSVSDPAGTLPAGRYEVYARDADGGWFPFSPLIITAEQMDGRPVGYGLWCGETRDITAFSLPVPAEGSGENSAEWSAELSCQA